MYLEHFNFNSPPFSIAPNPRFVYLSAQHREALAHLLYGIQMGGGFVALTGEVGTGKTTLCRCLLEQLPEDVDIALIFNPRQSHRELLASICDELHIANPGPRGSNKALIDLLNHHLLETHAQGRRTVLLIDEAQNLRRDVLEQIRLLTNLETNETKLLQIILVGQPELRDMLATSELRQLSQRITARYHLGPLSQAETRAYIEHRLAVAGGRGHLFNAGAISRIHGLSKGIPRLINLICDRSLLGAYALGRIDVTPAIVNNAAKEILAQPRSPWRVRPALRRLASLTLAAALVHWLGGWQWALDQASRWQQGNPPGISPRAATVEATSALVKPAAKIPAQDAADHPSASVSAAELTEAMTEAPSLIPTPSAILPVTTSAPPLEPATDAVEQTSPAVATQENLRPTPNPIPPTWAQLLADAPTDKTSSLGELFTLWGVKGWQGGDECLFSRGYGLRCQPFEGSWREMITLNHPAVLEFRSGTDSLRYATLVRMNGDTPVLVLPNGQHEVAVSDLKATWSGKAILLWKPPPAYTGAIEGSRRGLAVKWLRDRLQIKAKPGQEQLVDQALIGRVFNFQREHGLLVDGSAGPLTLICLNGEQKDGPRLGLPPVWQQN